MNKISGSAVALRHLAAPGALVLALDQLTKFQARASLAELPEGFTLIPNLLNLHYTTNTGAAWSLLEGYAKALGILGMLVIIAVIWMRAIFYVDNSSGRWGLGMILGGILGNSIDRLYYGYVVDFIDVHYKLYHWPTFNFADAGISLGILLYGLGLWLSQHPNAKPTNSS